ncbi:MAG: type VI secretion system ATPase TssH [Alphaproteobacteria bacterium]
MTSNLKSLVGKLDRTARSALEAAGGLCLARTHYEVDLEHWLVRLLEAHNTDLHAILRHAGIDAGRATAELTAALDRLRGGNPRTPVLARRLLDLAERAWLVASIDHGSAVVRSGHLLLAALAEPETARLLAQSAPSLAALKVGDLAAGLADITSGSDEAREAVPEAPSASSAPSAAPGTVPQGHAHGGHAHGGQTPALDQFTVNLTARAKADAIDPVLGRDGEIRQMVDILTRRRQNNPILTGEAGVGKTAVVEGLARRIAQDDVPPALKGVQIHALDLGLLQAGASVKGEFERRLKAVIDEVKASTVPIILFIDEAHTLIGAGGAAGQNDAANLLKPALARGELRTVAATTWAEYKKYFEKDAALARRFQVVKVEEPTEPTAAVMLRGLMAAMETHHKVRILDEAVTEAVRLSARYLSGRQLPDKAVSVLDTACARVAVSQAATPAALEDLTRRADAIEVELRALAREAATGAAHGERVAVLEAEQASLATETAALTQRWEQEKTLVARILELRGKLEVEGAAALDDAARAAARDELASVSAEIAALQGEAPLLHAVVTGQAVSEVISGWTGIPVGKMLTDEIRTVLALDGLLKERVIGQGHALEAIARRVQTSRAHLDDPGRPIGVFLLVGPSGVGKTETALALADILYGGERNLVTINMSEFQEAHTVSTLKGSPPGYVGYGEGGVLTEAVRRRPFSVVLLDEIEKAHPDVLELFFQVFDKGRLDDGEGRQIDFRNTLIVLTSNVGTATLMRACTARPMPDVETLRDLLRPELQAAFKPAFLGRMVVIPYYPIQDEALRAVIGLKLGKVRRRLAESQKAELVFADSVVEAIAARCTEVDSGARTIDHVLTGSMLPEISTAILARMAAGERTARVDVEADAGGRLSFAFA